MSTGIILRIAFIILIIFIILNQISTHFYQKSRQKEWDEVKSMLIEFAPYITQDELRETYINYISEIKYYE